MRFDWVLPLAVHCLFKTHLPASIAFSEKEKCVPQRGGGVMVIIRESINKQCYRKKKVDKKSNKTKNKVNNADRKLPQYKQKAYLEAKKCFKMILKIPV